MAVSESQPRPHDLSGRRRQRPPQGGGGGGDEGRSGGGWVGCMGWGEAPRAELTQLTTRYCQTDTFDPRHCHKDPVEPRMMPYIPACPQDDAIHRHYIPGSFSHARTHFRSNPTTAAVVGGLSPVALRILGVGTHGNVGMCYKLCGWLIPTKQVVHKGFVA